MKHNILLLGILVGLLVACQEESNSDLTPNTLIGTWKLTEVLADPGDGSGTFQPVESAQVIVIHGDNSFISTERLCNGLYQGPSQNTGTVDVVNSLLWIDNCDFSPGSSTIYFRHIDDELILSFQCIEPCREKYIRIDGPSVFDR